MELITKILELVTAVICLQTAQTEARAQAAREQRRKRRRRNQARRRRGGKSNGR